MTVDLTPNVYAHWKLNESFGNNCADSSVNGRDGIRVNMEDGDWVTGKLNNCLQFDGVNEYVNCGDIANFDRTNTFSLECWFKTNSAANQDIIARQASSSPYKGWSLNMNDGFITLHLINTYGNNEIIVYHATTTYNDNAWHHVVVTYDGSSLASGVHIYIDNVNLSLTIHKDILTASIQNPNICSISSRNGALLYYHDNIDEVVIYDKELSSDEVNFRWNSGAGTEEMSEASSPPTAPNEFESFDPRKAYRTKLGSMWNVNKDCDDLEYCIYITDSKGDRVYIPMYLSEEVKSEQLPDLPFIELQIPPGHTTYEPQDIGASTRKMESYILVHIYFTDTDNIDRTEFAKKIKDRLHNLTRYYQSTTDGIVFMNIQDDGLEEETDGHRVIFHYIATLYILYYDTCVEP